MERYVLCTWAVVLIGCAAACGQIQNGGFEADPFNGSGWQTSGNWQIANSFSTAPYYPNKIYQLVNLNPYEGHNIAVLYTGGGSSQTSFGELTQQVNVSAGQTISGAYWYGTADYLGWNDFGSIKLIPDSGSGLAEILLAVKSTADVGDHSAMPGWATFSYTFNNSQSGAYILRVRVEDAVDMVYSSYFAVDGLTITPEPGTMGLLAMGAMFLRRRISRTQVQKY